MKSFGKQPAAILAAGSFALAMTSCQQQSSQNGGDAIQTSSSTSQVWTQVFKKISETLRGGFGSSAPLNGSNKREEEGEEIYEDDGAGE